MRVRRSFGSREVACLIVGVWDGRGRLKPLGRAKARPYNRPYNLVACSIICV
jgi:hypothetical protein